jgi:diguanylate cyclase (GGDEF)-like protein
MKSFFPVSIQRIALVFVFGLLALVALIGGFAAYQTRNVTLNLERHSHDAARAELVAAMQHLLGQTESQAAALASWDETRQQLVSPEYYSYWRDQRVFDARMLNNHVARAGLYDPGRAALAANPPALGLPAALPADLPAHVAASWLAREPAGLVLYHAFPIYSDEGRRALLGHGLLRVDFLAALLSETHFQFVDVRSIAVPLQAGERLRTAELSERMRFAARPDADQQRFQAILSHTLLALLLLLTGTALVSAWVYNRLLVRPLRQLSHDLDAMQQGRFKPDPQRSRRMHILELENIRRSLYDYQLQLRELHGSLEHQNREFHSQARQDALTGCFNRRAYEEDWDAFQQTMQASPEGVAFLLFDCDRFKAINDTYGHAKGDRVLTLIADALVMALRANDRLYRLGGDEFATFLAHTTPAHARQIAQRCQSLLDASAFTDLGIVEPVGISIGIAFCPPEAIERLDELPKQADIAMYTAKQPGRNRIAVYGEDTERAAHALVASRETSALFQALATPGMIELHYQGIHGLPGRQIDYYEALARIRYEGTLIRPDAFLPVVSARRLEAAFDLAVLQQVDVDLASGQIPAGRGVSINLSAQSISKPEVVSQLLELARHIADHPLMLEITETSLITQMSEVRTYLDLLRTLRYRIAMDDFGTGYSPLRYLVDLPVDVVKFDISLVAKLGHDDRAGRVVADFARMMADVGYSLVAEGVEDETVLARVEALGIAHVQGYLLGRPASLAALGRTGTPEALRAVEAGA